MINSNEKPHLKHNGYETLSIPSFHSFHKILKFNTSIELNGRLNVNELK